MSPRSKSTWRATTIATLALVCLAACAHRDEAAGDSQASATAAPAATNFTQAADESNAAASSEPSSPPLSQADATASDGSARAPTPAPAGTDSSVAAAGATPSLEPSGGDEPQSTAAPTGSEPQCITLEAEPYCRAWSNDTAVSTQTEYVRSGETVNAWKRMITIVRYKNVASLDQVIPTYMKLVQPSLYPQGAKPVFITPDSPQHKQEIATRFLLSAANASDNEYTVAYFRADDTPPAYSLIFSQHITPGMDSPSQHLYESWINDLRSVKL
jgi:hypothetical protein